MRLLQLPRLQGPATRKSARARRKRIAPIQCEALETRLVLSAGTATSAAAQAFLQVTPMATAGYTTYTPQQIDSAYGISNVTFSNASGTASLSGNGSGQTIAIVDPYNDPNIQSDLAAFDAKYGLSAPPSFKVDNLGATTTDAGWALETALDVEWAHAIAPKANIVLVEAPNASIGSLLSGVSAAAKLPGVSVVSMSWGTSEFYGEAAYAGVFSTPAGHTPETFIAASGDSGAWAGPTFPSVLPDVLAVGGTSLTLGSGGSYGSETGWSGSTGGFSGLDNNFTSGISVPSYQSATLTAVGLNYGLRTTPDVSFNASPNTGYAVYDSVPYNGSTGWYAVGGTSAAAPAWAGLVAMTDQGLAAAGKSTLSTNQLLTDLYSLPSSDFHDITSGFNGYSAGPGYDLVTGLGTPKANLLVPGLLSASGVKPVTTTPSPTTTTHSSSTSAAVRSAVAVAGATSSGTTMMTVASPATSTVTALAALTSPTATTVSATASPGAAAPAVASSAGVAAPIGFGQAAPTSGLKQATETFRSDEGEAPATTADMVESSQDAPPAMPSSPGPRGSDVEMPTLDPEAPTDPESLPPADSPIGSRDPRNSDEIAIDAAPAVPIDSMGRREEESDEALQDEGRPGSGAALMVAGAAVALGHRLTLGRGRRRPPTAAFPASAR